MYIVRKITSSKAVTGKLYINGQFVCDTLENKDKLIPAGIYSLEVSNSPAFTKKRGVKTALALIYGDKVAASRGIRIHAGNKYTESSGCVLVGDSSGDTLVNSREAETVVTYLARRDRELMIIE